MDDWLPIDLHIHSALSPCADNQMTPNNIVNMAKVLGLRAIAVTDHQAADNVKSVQKLAEQAGLVYIPAMEVQSKEEIHLLCYFPDIEALEWFAGTVEASLDHRFQIETAHFGDQLVMDENDRILSRKRVLLSQSSELTLEQIWKMIRRLGGCCVPAHVDRQTYSLLGQLGFVPPELGISTLEVSMHGILNNWHLARLQAGEYKVITSSDAHCLEQMVTVGRTRVSPDALSVTHILSALRTAQPRLLRTFVMDA